jgi:hypothetical protein
VIGLDNDRKITLELDDTRESHILEIESYGELHEVPVLFNGDSTIYIECGISKDGSPKVKFLDKSEGEKKFSKVKYAP